ncbi:ATP-dependent nuclease subunit A [Bacillus sp. TS-2]|nr:ATP-dependent nuclease subunit A [Bacillus sp. TS-2]
MNFNDAQKKAIFNEQPFIVISAGAGSGKTRVLTERIIYLCDLNRTDPTHEMGVYIDKIVAITFTEKAAREMKERLRLRLLEKIEYAQKEEEKKYWIEQKNGLEKMVISTFHSFCQQLITQHAIISKLPPKAKVIDEVQANQMKEEMLEALFRENHFMKQAEILFDFMTKSQLSMYLLQTLDEMRESYVGPSQIQELRYTEMKEIQERIVSDSIRKKIEHFYRKARLYIEQFIDYQDLTPAQVKHVSNIQQGFTELDTQMSDEEIIEACEGWMPNRGDKKWEQKIPPLYFLYELEWKPLKKWWKEVKPFVTFSEKSSTILKSFLQLVQELDESYNLHKMYLGVVDFSDLQQKAVALLQNPSIQKECQKHYHHIMVDEFQDTNQLQLEMLKRIRPKYQFLVGDTKQSIYRFRGANVSIMNRLEQEAKTRNDGDAISLNMNYRTVEPIIEAVNELFTEVMETNPTYSFETVYTPLKAGRLSTNSNEKAVELIQVEEEENQYEVLAKRLISLMQDKEQRGRSWKDIAILIPTRTKLLQLESALKNYQIPYSVSGGIGFFERQEVIDFIYFLRWLNRPFEDLYVLALLRGPLIGLTINDILDIKEQKNERTFYEFLYHLKPRDVDLCGTKVLEAAQTLQKWLTNYIPAQKVPTVSIFLNRLFEETGMKKNLLLQTNSLQKIKNVEKVIQMIEQQHCFLYEEMIAVIDERIKINDKEGEAEVERYGGDALQIMTVHASKGLEFPIVCLPQIERKPRADKGLIRFSADMGIVFSLLEEEQEKKRLYETPGYSRVKELGQLESIEEEKRLFYVAATRARDHLIMVGSNSSQSNSWLEMVEKAKEKSTISSYINEGSFTFEEEAVSSTQKYYSPPSIVMKKRSLTSVSVSEVMLYIKNKVEYFERYVLKVEDEQKRDFLEKELFGEPLPVAAELMGTMVHKACELMDQGMLPEEAIDESIAPKARLMDAIQKIEVRILLTNLLKTYNEPMRKQLGKPIENEWSFTYPLEEADAEIIGEVDKIVKREDGIHLIDFKSNQISHSGAELIPLYKEQLLLYKWAIEYHQKVILQSASLFVFRDENQPLHSLTFLDEDRHVLIKEIKELVKRKKKAKTRKEWLMS